MKWYRDTRARLIRCGARLPAGGRCRSWALKGKRRCKWHGGKSTGPRTAEGMARTLRAMWWGRKRMIERRHAMGLKAPGGRLPSVATMMTKMDRAMAIANELLRRMDEEAKEGEAGSKS